MRRRQVAILVVVGVLASWPQGVEAVILINEVLADPPALTGDANADGVVSSSQDEFVELANTGADSVGLAHWMLSDSIQVRHVFAPADSIPGLGFFVIFGSTASTGGLSLNNAGDTISLRDSLSMLVDAFSYGAEGGMDVSLTRSPDATGGFVKHTTISSAAFSPGRTVNGSSTLPAPSRSTIPEPSSLLLLGVGLFGIKLNRYEYKLK